MLRIAGILLVFYVGLMVIVYFRQRSMIFFPTHAQPSTSLTPWHDGEQIIGYCREVPNADTIWLMMHGNAGQAAHRDYVLNRLSAHDSLYVMEYPGYGAREGTPSLESMNRAATQAYQWLRARNPTRPICVLAESIGSGPACALAREKIPPDKIVLIVPFDSMANLAAGKLPFLPVRLLLRDPWDNRESLKHYTGPVEIFGAEDDTIIPLRHAKALAGQIPTARFTSISGGHNDWSDNTQVAIKR